MKLPALLAASFVIASALAGGLGSRDTPLRFSGLATLVGPVSCSTAAFRSEDLSDPDYVNRLHIIIQVPEGCAVTSEKFRGAIKVAALEDGRMLLQAGSWIVTMMPMDRSVREFMIAGSKASNGGYEIRQQTLIIRPWAEGSYEFLIEEPLTSENRAAGCQRVACRDTTR